MIAADAALGPTALHQVADGDIVSVRAAVPTDGSANMV